MTDSAIKLEISLPKIHDIELIALEGLNRMGGYMNIPEDKLGEARILVTEAIINAFEHSGDSCEIVDVQFVMTNKSLTILVSDTGSGFEVNGIKEPDISDKLSSDSKRGWGIKLMQSMSDNFILESSKKGTKIILTKNFS